MILCVKKLQNYKILPKDKIDPHFLNPYDNSPSISSFCVLF